MSLKVGDKVSLIFKKDKQKSLNVHNLIIDYLYIGYGVNSDKAKKSLSQKSIDYLKGKCSGSAQMSKNEITIIKQDEKSPEYYLGEYIDERKKKVSLAFHRDCIYIPYETQSLSENITTLNKLMNDI